GLNQAALRAAAIVLGERVAAASDAELADLCWVSGARRTHHEHRFAVTGGSRQELLDGLAALGRGESGRDTRTAAARPGEHRRLAVVYGSKASDLPWTRLLGAGGPGPLDGTAPEQLLGGGTAVRAFRAAVAEVDAALRETIGFSPVQAWESGEKPASGT